MEESTRDPSAPPAQTASSLRTGPWYDVATLDKFIAALNTVPGCVKPPMDSLNALGLASIAEGERCRGMGQKAFAVADEIGEVLESAPDLMPQGLSHAWYMKLLESRHKILETKAFVHDLGNRVDSCDDISGAILDKALREIYIVCKLAAQNGNDTAIYALKIIRPLYKRNPRRSPRNGNHDDGVQTLNLTHKS